jgi:hypothetical protein
VTGVHARAEAQRQKGSSVKGMRAVFFSVGRRRGSELDKGAFRCPRGAMRGGSAP